MATILLVIHLLIAVALVATILLQRSEGGALGIGGGGGGGGFMSNRAAGNALTRGAAILAALFFVTSIGLTLVAKFDDRGISILDAVSEDVTAPLIPETSSAPTDATPPPAPVGIEEPASQGPLVPRAE